MVRSTTSITMDRAVLRWIQGKVEEGVFASRSHAIEYAVRQLMRQERATVGTNPTRPGRK